MTETADIAGRLEAVRAKMKDAQIDALWIPRADEFLGEYVPVHNERLAFLTGFTGSAGVCVVTADQAIMFVDGRNADMVANVVREAIHYFCNVSKKREMTLFCDQTMC